MKHNKWIFGLMLVALFSCKKLINIEETDSVAGETALKTVENNESSIIGGYAAMNIEMDILLNATFSDEVKVAEFYNAGTTHEWQYGSTDVGIRDNFTAMSPHYRVIDRVNRVLAALPTADSTRVGDNTLKLKLRGEALFMRAWAHFELFRMYCGNYDPTGLAMPYLEGSSILGQERIQMAPYFQKINADLAEAKTLVPNNLSDISRITRLGVAGIQARVALYMRDWANAVTYATEYISGVPLAVGSQFTAMWGYPNASTEQAFRLFKTNTVGGRIGSLFRAVGNPAPAPTGMPGTITWRPSDKLTNAYDAVNDIRYNVTIKNEPVLATAGRNTRMINKYPGSGAYGSANENVSHGIVMRTAEMVLIRAEARAELGTFTGANSAESDINTLRAARISGYIPVTFATKQAAIDAVVDERFKELAYEGHRFFDLRRRGLPVSRLAADAPTANAQTLAAGNFRFVLPIPQTEILASQGKMVQNPGY
jgi:starch-binding outer membrane protein, SusD/RagB family